MLKGIIATRIVEHNGSCVLRVVDFIGDTSILGECGSALQKLLVDQRLEYMDFWQYGISSEVLAKAGFHKVDPIGKLICPNNFEPFISENASLNCCVKGELDKSFIVCRADGDQDRPNELGGL